MGQSIGNSSSPPSAGSYNRGGPMRDTGRDYRQFQGRPEPQSQYQPQQQQPQPQYQPQQGYGRPMPQRGYGGGYGGGYGPPAGYGGAMSQMFRSSFGRGDAMPQLGARNPMQSALGSPEQAQIQPPDWAKMGAPATDIPAAQPTPAQGGQIDPQMLQSLLGNQQLMQALQSLMRGGGMQSNNSDRSYEYGTALNIRPTSNQLMSPANYG